MRFPALFCIAATVPLLFSCAGKITTIEHVREVPLKTTSLPSEDVGMHRSQATFLLYGAVSNKERVQRQGQYYFVTWYDADPDQAVTLVMMYRQGKTGSRILTKSISYPAGRKGGTQSPVFEFIGDDAKENGQILAWKLLLKDQNGAKPCRNAIPTFGTIKFNPPAPRRRVNNKTGIGTASPSKDEKLPALSGFCRSPASFHPAAGGIRLPDASRGAYGRRRRGFPILPPSCPIRCTGP